MNKDLMRRSTLTFSLDSYFQTWHVHEVKFSMGEEVA